MEENPIPSKRCGSRKFLMKLLVFSMVFMVLMVHVADGANVTKGVNTPKKNNVTPAPQVNNISSVESTKDPGIPAGVTTNTTRNPKAAPAPTPTATTILNGAVKTAKPATERSTTAQVVAETTSSSTTEASTSETLVLTIADVTSTKAPEPTTKKVPPPAPTPPVTTEPTSPTTSATLKTIPTTPTTSKSTTTTEPTKPTTPKTTTITSTSATIPKTSPTLAPATAPPPPPPTTKKQAPRTSASPTIAPPTPVPTVQSTGKSPVSSKPEATLNPKSPSNPDRTDCDDENGCTSPAPNFPTALPLKNMTCPAKEDETCTLCEMLLKGKEGTGDNTPVIVSGVFLFILIAANVAAGVMQKMCKGSKSDAGGKHLDAEAGISNNVKQAKSKTKAQNKADDGKDGDKSSEAPSPPSVKINNKLKTQLMETQNNLARLRAHVKKSTAQHKSDIRSSKFKKKGPIFIPMEPDVPPGATNLPDNIILENVIYDPSGNEMYDIGSDVDDIEMDTSLTLDAGPTITEEEKSGDKKTPSKKSKKSKQSKKEPKKKDQPKADQKDAKSHKSGKSQPRSKKSNKSKEK